MSQAQQYPITDLSELRKHFDPKGEPLSFPEGDPPLDNDLLRQAEDSGLIRYHYGTGWSIEDAISLTSKGRHLLGYPKQNWWQRLFARWF